MNTTQVRKIVGNKIFSATFTKKDGTERKMLCKLGVKKHLKGGVKKYDTESLNYLTVYSLDSRGYRTINLNTLKSIKCGKTWKV
jgi:hypothetical protein